MAAISRSKTATVNTILSLATVVIAGVGGIVTVPTYLHHIPVALYGAWLASGNIITWATMIDPGLSFLTQQQVAVAYGAGNLSRVGTTAFCGMLLNSGMALVLALAAGVLVFLLPFLLTLDESVDLRQLQIACWLSCLGLGLNVASYALRATSMGMQSSYAVQSFAIVELTLSMVLQVYLVEAGWGLYGIAAGSLVRGGGDLLLNGIYLAFRFSKEKIVLRYSPRVVNKMLGLVSFTFAGKAVETISTNMDAFLTARLISPEAAVLLRTTRIPPDICISIINRPAAAISPVLSHIAGAGELAAKRNQIARIILVSLWIAIFAAMGIFALNASFIGIWVGSQFFAGGQTNVVLCLSLLVVSAFRLFSNMTNAIGDIKATSIITVVQSLLSLGAMVGLGHLFGLPGVASGVLIGACYGALSCGLLLSKQGILDRATLVLLGRELLLGLGCLVVTALVAKQFLPPPHSWAAFMAQACAVSMLFMILLTMVSSALRGELGKIYKLIKRRLMPADGLR